MKYMHAKGIVPLTLLALAVIFLYPAAGEAQDFFQEGFDNSAFMDRGWYDNTGLILSTVEKHSGVSSAEFRYVAGNVRPLFNAGSGISRKKFSPSESVYISYYVKYDASWETSIPNQLQREVYLLTNMEESENTGPTQTFLAFQSLLISGKPVFAISDEKNINIAYLYQEAAAITEQRAVAGCNGTSDGYPAGQCIDLGGQMFRNFKDWETNNVCPLNRWLHIEIFVKLNTIANGKSVSDGIIQYWLDGQLKRDLHDVVLRTGQHPDMKFNQFIISPYISGGATRAQTFWLDDLSVAAAPPSTPAPSMV